MESNCTDQGNLQWTYNYGIYLMGAAYMYNYTNGSDVWLQRVNGLLDQTLQEFFPKKYGGQVMSEIACEPNMKCDRNQACFKGLTASWLAFTTYYIPGSAAKITPYLQASAKAASKQCSGGGNGRQCGLRWWQSTWDGTQGLEQEMSVLNLYVHQLVGMTGHAPFSMRTGGTSKSNPGLAGDGGHTDSDGARPLGPISTGDKAGAGILTALVLFMILGGAAWILIK